MTNLCEKLVNIASVYYALGNNEYEAKLFKDSNITKDLKAVGVHVLDDASEIVDIKDTKLNIGGLSQGPEQFERYGHQFFDKYIEEDYFKLLLVHYPDELRSCSRRSGANSVCWGTLCDGTGILPQAC